jgi:hypothetical protein
LRHRLVGMAVLAASVCIGGAPASAQATRYEFLDGAHWDAHASGAADGRPRTLLVLDATGDARAHQALRDFASRWNAMRAEPRFRSARLPAVAVRRGSASDGCAVEGRPGVDVLVCREDGLATSGIGGPYRVDAEGHTRLGMVKLRGTTLAWASCNLRTAVAHEMGHVMGLGHNDLDPFAAGPSVMMPGQGPYRRGCPTWFNADDQDALRSLYGRHPGAERADTDPDDPNAAPVPGRGAGGGGR